VIEKTITEVFGENFSDTDGDYRRSKLNQTSMGLTLVERNHMNELTEKEKLEHFIFQLKIANAFKELAG